MGIHHVVADQRGHRDDGGDGYVGMRCKLAQRCADVRKSQRRIGDGVEFVDGKHNRRHAQQIDQQRVATGLRQQLG